MIIKKKNDEICKQQEEEKKQSKDEEKAHRIQEEAEKEDEFITPRNLHDVMNGLDYSPPEAMEEDDKGDECSPLKKRSGSSKFAMRRTRALQVLPPEPTTTALSAPPPTKTTTFLDLIIYPHSQTDIGLAIALKSNKAFKEFTQALMTFITNAQMVDSKFVYNPLDPNSKEKNISSNREISPIMTKLGIHIKISGNSNVFNRKKVWGNQANNCKSHKSKRKNSATPLSGSPWSFSPWFRQRRILTASPTSGHASMAPDSKSRTCNQLTARWSLLSLKSPR